MVLKGYRNALFFKNPCIIYQMIIKYSFKMKPLLFKQFYLKQLWLSILFSTVVELIETK